MGFRILTEPRYEHTCDACKTAVVTDGGNPKGWTSIMFSIYGPHMRPGASEAALFCPACALSVVAGLRPEDVLAAEGTER